MSITIRLRATAERAQAIGRILGFFRVTQRRRKRFSVSDKRSSGRNALKLNHGDAFASAGVPLPTNAFSKTATLSRHLSKLCCQPTNNTSLNLPRAVQTHIQTLTGSLNARSMASAEVLSTGLNALLHFSDNLVLHPALTHRAFFMARLFLGNPICT